MKTQSLCRDAVCDPGVAERPRYYARQLITADDMALEQEYFRSKLRLHNRLLHGWGVVCGAVVCPVPESDKKEGAGYEHWKVAVRPGYALDCCGNEIHIDCCRIVDLRTRGVTGVTGDPCVEARDPWCSEVFERCQADRLYVAVKYRQVATRPVRVQPVGCGCDDTRCENSRWRDGYEIRILTYCPESHENPPDFDYLMTDGIPQCPECPEDSWIVLAEVQVDAEGMIAKIDNCSCRRMALSFGHFWWRCHSASITITSVTPYEQLKANVTDVDVTLVGKNFQSGATVDLGSGVVVKHVNVVDSQTIKFSVDVESDAVPGPRVLTVKNPDCTLATVMEGVTIAAFEDKPVPKPPTRKAGPRRSSRG